MSKNDHFSLMKTSLYYWLELQLATLFSFVSIWIAGLLSLLGDSAVFSNICLLVVENMTVWLLVFWRFSRTPAHEADSFKTYLICCAVAFMLHLIFGLVPFVTTVGLSPEFFARLTGYGWQAVADKIDVSYFQIWPWFALLCIPKFGAAVLAYFYRKRKDQKKQMHIV